MAEGGDLSMKFEVVELLPPARGKVGMGVVNRINLESDSNGTYLSSNPLK